MKNAVIDFIPGVAVDELAELLAKIAPLQKKADAIKEQLKATGMERILGSFHEAVISLSERETIDTKALREVFDVTPYLRSTLVTTLKVTARKVH
jgi:hypothetical protein